MFFCNRQHLVCRVLVPALASAALLLPVQVQAAPIQFRITGAIDVQFQVCPLPPGVSQGSSFEAILSYDLATPDSRPDDPNRGVYTTTGIETNFLIVHAGATEIRSSAPLTLDVTNDRDVDNPMSIDGFPDDSFSLSSVPFEANFEQPSISILRFQLFDPTRSAFNSDALPTSLNPSDFVAPFSLGDPFIEISTFELDSRVYQFTANAVIESITVIPEPSSLAISIVATAIVFLICRPNHRS